jgi:hypothetical protein
MEALARLLLLLLLPASSGPLGKSLDRERDKATPLALSAAREQASVRVSPEEGGEDRERPRALKRPGLETSSAAGLEEDRGLPLSAPEEEAAAEEGQPSSSSAEAQPRALDRQEKGGGVLEAEGD